MDLPLRAHRPLVSLRLSRSVAEIRGIRVPDGVVVGRRQSRQDRIAFVIFATRRRALALAAGSAAGFLPLPVDWSRARADDLIEAHGLSAFGDLAYPADFQH